MIGSIDMVAKLSSMPVTSIATIGRLSGICDQPPFGFSVVADLSVAGRGFSLMRKVVARNARKITPPATRKVARMPIKGGSAPPSRGPTRAPPVMPADSTPSAQPDRSFGVCMATRMVEPEE
jgi:hypothetical protein